MPRSLALLLLVASTASAADRPNIVWITTEDNAAHYYRLYDPDHGAAMPTVERLAAEGLTFENAYSGSPVCSVARTALLTGCHPPRFGAQYHRPERKVRLPDGVQPFPKLLRDAGYHTSNNRKTDYNVVAEQVDGTWDESSAKATYRSRAEGQPFFHVRNFTNTHESQLFGGLKPGIEPTVSPDEVTLLPYHPDTPLFRQKTAQYLAMHTHVDTLIGQVVDGLERDGLLEDTFIFHFGDHGGVLPGSKGYARDDGLHVALVVRIPENWKHLAPAPRGSRIDGFAHFVDLSATVLRLAGLDVPEAIDGRPLLGEGVELDELNARDESLAYADRFDAKSDMVRWLRVGPLSYRRSYQPFNFDGLYNNYRYLQPAYRQWRELHLAGELTPMQDAFFRPRPPEELYDLRSDPHEVSNLADDPDRAMELSGMRRQLRERLLELPDVGFLPEASLLAGGRDDLASLAIEKRGEIANAMAIADLQLRPWDEAKPGIETALAGDSLSQYWAWIVCSRFAADEATRGSATAMVPAATEAISSAADPLVRARAAEFLGLVGERDAAAESLVAILRGLDDPVAAASVLNTMVLLRDGPSAIRFDVDAVIDEAGWVESAETLTKSPAGRRLHEFLHPEEHPATRRFE